MTRFRKGAITCPCCQERYWTEIIFSTIWSGDVSSDLLRYSMGKMPINYLVHTCPECGWSGKGEFPEPEPEKVRLFIRENITPLLDKDPVPPWRRWEFFSWIRGAAGGTDLELGENLLIASQCARLGQEAQEEERLRRQSIVHFQEALKKGEVPEDSLYKINYLVGELYRRSGDAWKASEWFEKVLKLDFDHPTRSFFTDLARRQLNNPRDMVGEEQKEERQMIQKRKLPGFLARLLPGKKPN